MPYHWPQGQLVKNKMNGPHHYPSPLLLSHFSTDFSWTGSPFYLYDFRQQQAGSLLKSPPTCHLRLTPAALLFYLLPNLNLYDSPRASSSSKLRIERTHAIIHAKWLSYLTINTGKSLTQPTHSRGGSHEHLLRRPNRVLGLLYRLKVDAPPNRLCGHQGGPLPLIRGHALILQKRWCSLP